MVYNNVIICLHYVHSCIKGENTVKLLEDRIQKEGKIFPGNIVKVDGFINQRIDVGLLKEIGKEFCRLFKDSGVNKILTVEASGIAFACAAAMELGCDVVFAKKSGHKNIGDDVYSEKVFSYTKGVEYDVVVSKEHLGAGDRVLIIDDFLAVGNAVKGLIGIVNSAGAETVGVGIVIEKGFQTGGKELRDAGVHLESLAIIESIDEKGVTFR